MENTKELRELEKIVNLDVQMINKIIIRFYDYYGINLAVNVYGTIYILEDYFLAIIEEYKRLETFIIPVEEARELKSERVTVFNGNYIYFLFDENTLVYIGQSVNIAGRIPSHLQDKVFDSVFFREIPADEKLLIESINIKFYLPKYNRDMRTSGELFLGSLRRLFL